MRLRLTLFCISLLSLTGCGSTPISSTAPQEATGARPVAVVTRQQLEASGATTLSEYVRDSTFLPIPAPDDTVLLINAPGGAFHQYTTDTIDAPLDMTVELTIKRINTHPQFGPRGGVCVSSGASDHHACIYVERRHADGTELQVKRNLYKGKTLMSSVPMAGSFEVGDPIMIGLRSRADTIEFKVDDGAWQMQALPFSPKLIDVLCSSAVCKLHLSPGTKAAD